MEPEHASNHALSGRGAFIWGRELGIYLMQTFSYNIVPKQLQRSIQSDQARIDVA